MGIFFRMKMKGGRLAVGPELRNVIEARAGGSFVKAALIVQGGIQQSSPVKSGTLRRSWTTSGLMWNGARMFVRVGTNLVYAAYQNTRTINRGYVKRGYDAVKEQAKAQIQAGLQTIGKGFWRAG